jgi:hypothetical protein
MKNTRPRSKEPQQAGDLVGPLAGSRFMNTSTCGYCGHDFGRIVSTAICDDCDRKALEARAESDQAGEMKKRQKLESKWHDQAGDYHDTEAGRLPMEASRTVLQRWGPALRFGVTLLGSRAEGATGRSRTIWGLMRKAYDNQQSFICRPAADFRQAANTLARHGEGAKGIEELVKVKVLGIDDFGLQTFTATSCELFALVLEKRTKAGRPTVIGCPLTAKMLATAFELCGAGATGSNFLRRISRQHAWLIDATTDTLSQPER